MPREDDMFDYEKKTCENCGREGISLVYTKNGAFCRKCGLRLKRFGEDTEENGGIDCSISPFSCP